MHSFLIGFVLSIMSVLSYAGMTDAVSASETQAASDISNIQPASSLSLNSAMEIKKERAIAAASEAEARKESAAAAASEAEARKESARAAVLEAHAKEKIAKADEGKSTLSQAWGIEKTVLFASIILIFTLACLLLTAFVLLKQKASPIYTLRSFILLTIFGLASFIVMVGFSVEQINGVISLFSAVIGYLLGKDTPKHIESRSDD